MPSLLLVGPSAVVAPLAAVLKRSSLRVQTRRHLAGLEAHSRDFPPHYVCLVRWKGDVAELPSTIRRLRHVLPDTVLCSSVVGSEGVERESLEAGLWAGLDGVFVEEGGARWIEAHLAQLGRRRRSLQRARRQFVRLRVLLVGSTEVFAATELAAPVDLRAFEVVRVPTVVDALHALRAHPTALIIFAESALAAAPGAGVAAALAFDPGLYVMVLGDTERRGVARALTEGAREVLWAPLGKRQLCWAITRATSTLEVEQSLASVRPGAHGGRVVVLVRTAYLRQLVRATLAAEGIETAAIDPSRAPDLPAAVAAARADVVLVCCETHGVDPAQSYLDLASGLEQVPTIAVAARPDAACIRRLIAAGADDVLDSTTIATQSLATRIIAARGRYAEQVKYRYAVADLQAREGSHRAMLDRSVDGIVVFNQDARVLYLNRAAEKLLQKDAATVLGLSFPWSETMDDRLALPPLPGEVEPRLAQVTYAEILWDDQPARLIYLRDITHEVNAAGLRERLLHAERLAAIGQLAAGITHEINNPASYVIANLVSLRRALEKRQAESSPFEDPVMNEFTAMMTESLEGMNRIREITQDLRTFARIESDEVELLDLNAVVESACNIARSEVRYRARLVKELAPVPKVAGAPGKLSQVATNLLMNAAQAIDEGTVEENHVTISTGCDAKEVWMVVEDSGPGIPVAIRSKIFEPFYTTKPRGVGTGLGLALCADIARQHGGTIAIHDRSGRGTRVEVRLPIAGPLVPSSLPPALPASAAVGRLRILIIDDEPLVLRGYQRMLREHELTLARGGDEGLACVERSAEYDLILCDLMMPGKDGVAVHQELVQRQPRLGDRFAFCSGGALTPRARNYVAEAAVPMLDKPLQVEAIARVVQSLRAADGDRAAELAKQEVG